MFNIMLNNLKKSIAISNNNLGLRKTLLSMELMYPILKMMKIIILSKTIKDINPY